MIRVFFALAAVGLFAATAAAQSPAHMSASTTPTIWDHLGVHQVGDLIHHVGRSLKTTAVFDYAANSVASPLLQTTGLNLGSAPTSFGPPPGYGAGPAGSPAASGGTPSGGTPSGGTPAPSGGAPAASGGAPAASGGTAGGGGADSGDAAAAAAAEAEAAAIEAASADATNIANTIAPKVDPANVLVKVKAIRFLARQDCSCYPEVVDALLGSLADCSEVVRYEALRALRAGCTHGGTCATCGGHQVPGDPGANGYACQCQVKVIKRLSDLLLERNVRGHLKERSERVRRLAGQMIVECVHSTPVAASRVTPGLQAEPDPPLPADPR